MSAECAKPIELEDELDTSGQSSNVTSQSQEMQCVVQLKHWIENEADFYGNTDEEFLLIFVYGCKFNVEKAKKNMIKYYENRRKLPKWWANRDVREEKMWALLQAKVTTALKVTDANKPTIVITQNCRLPRENCNVDDEFRFHAIVMESVLRRRNSLMNGVIWIMDLHDYPRWLVPQLISPFLLKDVGLSFMAISVRVKGVYILNCPSVSLGIWSFVKPFAGRNIKDRVFFYGSNWNEMFDRIPIEDIPEELGGRGGPIGPHEDAWMEELIAFNEHNVNDNKYGYVVKS